MSDIPAALTNTDDLPEGATNLYFQEAPNDGNQYARKNLGWEQVASNFGILGIADAAGEYTYYADYTTAMAAASAGDVIEQFGNITETGAIEITWKPDVLINSNGYKYTLNNAGTVNAFKITGQGTFKGVLNVVRSGSTSTATNTNSAICIDVAATSPNNVYDFEGSNFEGDLTSMWVYPLANPAFLSGTVINGGS